MFEDRRYKELAVSSSSRHLDITISSFLIVITNYILAHSAGPFSLCTFHHLKNNSITSQSQPPPSKLAKMQFTNLFFSLLLSTAVVAKGNKTTKAVTDKSLCREMAFLERMVALASNSTRLAAIEKDNATKIAEFQAKASTATTDLATMQSNTTLVSTCAVIAAAAKTEEECEKMSELQKLVTLASNETALAAKTKNNATKIADIQAEASAASVKLETLTSNTTLTDVCTSIKASKAADKASKAAKATGTTGM
jgi:hypothetical protein